MIQKGMSSRLVKEELVLYSLDLLIRKEEEERATISLDQMADAFGISKGTLDLYFTNLRKMGAIERHRKRYSRSISESFSISPEGKVELGKIEAKIMNLNLDPVKHNVPSIVPLNMVLSMFRDPLEKIMFLSIFQSSRSIDLFNYLQAIKEIRPESNTFRTLDHLMEDDEGTHPPIATTFFRACLIGDVELDDITDMEDCAEDAFHLLLLAEINQKQGRLDSSMIIFDHLLSGRIKISKNKSMVPCQNRESPICLQKR